MKKSIRTLIIAVLSFMTTSTLWAQTPQQFNYQAVLRDNGNLVTEESVDVRFSLRQASPNGTVVYKEAHNTTTDQFGHLNLSVGAGTALTGVFANIDWGSGAKYLQVEVNYGSGYEDMGAQQLLSVPYALHAGNSSSGSNPTGAAGGDLTGSYPNPAIANAAVTGSKIDQMGATNGQILKWNGTIWEPANDETGNNTGDDWGIQVIESDASLDGEGTITDPLGIADNAITTDKLANDAVTTTKISDAAITSQKLDQMGATNDQILKWNGVAWEPANDETGNNTGDDWGTQVAETNATLEGDGTLVNPLGVADNAITTNKLANDAVTTAKISDAAITSQKLDQMGAATDQFLKWNGTNWVPDNITSTGDDWGSQIAETDATLKGDGTTGNELGLAQNGATDGQILTWDDVNNNWIPSSQTIGGDGFFEADTDKITYGDTDDFGKDFLVNTDQIDHNSGEEYKIMFLPSKEGGFRAGRINNENWDINNIGNSSTAFGVSTKASGNFSTAMGIDTEASGEISTAMGLYTEASGPGSTAMGDGTKASGPASTAMGAETEASGPASTAMGLGTKAQSYSETAIGSYNTDYTALGTTDFNITDRQFIVGIGEDSGNQADGFMVMKSGLVTAPELTNILIDNNQDALVTKQYLDDNGGGDGFFEADDDQISYAETTDFGKDFLVNTDQIDYRFSNYNPDYKMMFLPSKKGAFRAGKIREFNNPGDSWDINNIGDSSTAFGENTKASGEGSFASGVSTEATGDYSTSLGWGNKAIGYTAIAMGSLNQASGDASVALGRENVASGQFTLATGNNNVASGPSATAMGRETIASGAFSTAMGMGTEASGSASTAMGVNAKALASNSTVIGRNITLSTTAKGSMFLGDTYRQTDIWAKTGANRFYAVFDNGYVLHTNGTTNSSYGVLLSHNSNSWSTISDRNKKENIEIVEGNYFIESIKKMELGSWNYIGQDAEKYRHWGPMAQDFHKYFGHDGIGKIGTDTTIATADIDGVMMIAIQQLARENDELKAALKAQTAQYEKSTGEMEERLSKIEALIQRTEQEIIYSEL